ILLSGHSLRIAAASAGAPEAKEAPRITSLGPLEMVAVLSSAVDPTSHTTRWDFFAISDLNASRTNKRGSMMMVVRFDSMTPILAYWTRAPRQVPFPRDTCSTLLYRLALAAHG